MANIKFYWHHLMVLLGFRRTISSTLRSFILPTRLIHPRLVHSSKPRPALPDLDTLIRSFPTTVTTAAYVILSDGKKTAIFDKDRITAQTRSSETFIAAANHDAKLEDRSENMIRPHRHLLLPGMEDMMEESIDRKACIEKRWIREVRHWQRRHRDEPEENCRIDPQKVIDWLQIYPTINECTHYAVVMDATKGDITWLRRWQEPIEIDEDERY